MLDEKTMRGQLLPLLQATAKRSLQDIGYFGGNVAQLMLAQTPHALIDADLEAAKIKGTDFDKGLSKKNKPEKIAATRDFVF